MAKKCKCADCNYPVFGGQFCVRHQFLRTDKQLKTLRKRREKSVGQYDLFKKIWAERPHVSFLTGKNLPENVPIEIWLSYFAHCLSKGKYIRYRLNKDNIILLDPEEHALLDQGTEDSRAIYEETHHCDFTKIYELKEKLRQEYERSFSSNAYTGQADKAVQV